MVRFGVIADSRIAAYYIALGGGAMRDPPLRRVRGRILVRLVDDRSLFAESLATAVHVSAPDIMVEHLTCLQALSDVAGVVQGAGVVLVNLGQARLTDGAPSKVVRALLSLPEHPPVAVLVPHAPRQLVRRALGLGLKGFLPATAPLSAAVAAIRVLDGGGIFVPDP